MSIRAESAGLVSLLALLVSLSLSGCGKSGPPAPAPAPETPGHFLDEPAGVPPDILQPDQITLRIVAGDMAAAKEALAKLAGVGEARQDGDTLVAPVTEPAALRQDQLIKLKAVGIRGSLVLWYPLMTIRERLNDGRAGVWRGITRLRSTLRTKGRARLGGTPVFMAAVLPAVDGALLGAGIPPGFQSRAARGPAPADIWLTPKSPSVMDGTFDQAVEALVPVVKQGGQAHLLIALPLAEAYKPERF